MKKYNSTLGKKIALRQVAMGIVESSPLIFECFGGVGLLYEKCYRPVRSGWTCERQERLAIALATQRPGWYVYAADTIDVISIGVAGGEPVNLLDIDAFGDPWPFIMAWFDGSRTRARRLVLVVTDGLRHKIMTGTAWQVFHLQPEIEQFGLHLLRDYLPACKAKLARQAKKAGYHMSGFHGYYCGAKKMMTHYLAILERGAA